MHPKKDRVGALPPGAAVNARSSGPSLEIERQSPSAGPASRRASRSPAARGRPPRWIRGSATGPGELDRLPGRPSAREAGAQRLMARDHPGPPRGESPPREPPAQPEGQGGW